jgi:MYXO-CTERM domain-containing protein
LLSLSCSRRTFPLITLLATCGVCSAGVITPGGVLNPAPAEADPVGGTVVGSLISQPFAAGLFSGTLTTRVISGDTTNPYGGLTFTYTLTHDVGSITSLGRLTTIGWSGWLSDASYLLGDAGNFPQIIDRPGSLGEVIGFTFSGTPTAPIAPGTTSTLLVVQTNATQFRQTIANVIDGAVAQVPTLSPIPTPGSVAILGLSGLALAARRRRA